MTEHKPLTEDWEINYFRSPDNYDQQVYDEVRSAVMGYTNRLEEIFKNAENHFEETSKELPGHIHDYFQNILDKTIIAVWESKEIWFPVFFQDSSEIGKEKKL